MDALGAAYDRWLTTQPEPPEPPPQPKCSHCGRFIPYEPVREEPWEDGWQCDGKATTIAFTYCNDIWDNAEKCWQDGWSVEEAKAHNEAHHKAHSYVVAKCGEGADHEPHFQVEAAGAILYRYCKACQAETKEVVM
jgi:hypothetical protein